MIKHQAIDSTLVGLLNTNLKVKYREMRNGKKLGGKNKKKKDKKKRKAGVKGYTKDLGV